LNGVLSGVSHARDFAACANCRGNLELASRKGLSMLASYARPRYKVTRPHSRAGPFPRFISRL